MQCELSSLSANITIARENLSLYLVLTALGRGGQQQQCGHLWGQPCGGNVKMRKVTTRCSRLSHHTVVEILLDNHCLRVVVTLPTRILQTFNIRYGRRKV